MEMQPETNKMQPAIRLIIGKVLSDLISTFFNLDTISLKRTLSEFFFNFRFTP